MDASNARSATPRGVITHPDRLDFDVRAAPPRPRETRVLLVDPAFYAVEYVINPHMAAHVGRVDPARAREQWEALREAYSRLELEICLLDGVRGLPDLVFVANQSFPLRFADGRWGAVLSRMRHAERQPEVAIVADWYRRAGGVTVPLDAGDSAFEGMGDALWIPGHRAIVAGFGFRTDPAAFERLAELADAPVAAVRLTDERFYHLDTCLAPLDAETALFVPEAFDAVGVALLEKLFPRLRALPVGESAEKLACNGHSPDGRHYLVQQGCARTNAIARELGYEVVELDTSEFLKSGGSVFCMKLMLP